MMEQLEAVHLRSSHSLSWKSFWKEASLSPTHGRILPNPGRIQRDGKESYRVVFPGTDLDIAKSVRMHHRAGVSTDVIFFVLADSLEESPRVVSRSGYNQALLNQLDEVREQCRLPAWDGYSAAPVLPDTYEKARQFIEALPPDLPLPEISADPDGEISFEWYSSPSQLFSVSIGPRDTLTYAGMFGPNKTHGTEVFRDDIPRVVLLYIRRVMS